MPTATTRVKVADQVWIALALLTYEHPEKIGFTNSEVEARVENEFQFQPGIKVHISGHCVASLRASPNRLRMITRLVDDHLIRLFRPGDPCHRDREGAKMKPIRGEIPRRYHFLLDWYDVEYAHPIKVFTPDALLLHLQAATGSGHKDISERHDEYLAELPMDSVPAEKPDSERVRHALTNKEIQVAAASLLGVSFSSIRTCWVAEVKRHYGLTKRVAWNRGRGTGAPPCPPNYWGAIEKVILRGNRR